MNFAQSTQMWPIINSNKKVAQEIAPRGGINNAWGIERAAKKTFTASIM